jgi:hypothetical protein
MTTWIKMKVICNNANNKLDCIGCGMNTSKDGFTWELNTRIPCVNANNGYCNYIHCENE